MKQKLNKILVIIIFIIIINFIIDLFDNTYNLLESFKMSKNIINLEIKSNLIKIVR
jgi:flagellar biosynthesis protein FlhB